MQNIKILTLIFDQNIRSFVKRTLAPCASQIIECENAQDSVAHVFSFQPELVIIGGKLEGSEALQLAHFIRESKKSPSPDTPLIVLGEQIEKIRPQFTILPQIFFFKFPFEELDLINFCGQIVQQRTRPKKQVKKHLPSTLRLKPGELIIRQGETENRLYWLKKGHLEVYTQTQDGKKHIVGEIKVGEIFGEMGYLSEAPRSASVCATLESEISIIMHEEFATLMGRTPNTVRALIHSLVGRLKETNKLVV